jgi:hypothetical protein
VEGQILARTSADDPNAVQSLGGEVTFVATELYALAAGVLASFRHSVHAEDDGLFQAALLPGLYRVRVVPPGDCSDVIPCGADEVVCECPLAATEITDFDVAPRDSAGRSVELEWQTRVAGQVSTSSGTAVADAEVLAISVPQRPTALQVALGAEAFVPRASAGQSDATGRFELFADAGSYNVSVRPEPEAGLAWLVRPNVSVRAGSGSPLEQLVLPLPVSYAGEVRVPGPDGGYAIVPRVGIKAYAPVDSGQPTSTVVQVAETVTNEEGAFQLLLPTRWSAGADSAGSGD